MSLDSHNDTDAEALRLEALQRLGLLDTPREARFDTLTDMATRLFDVPVALIGLVDADRYWIKSSRGVDAPSLPRELAFCNRTIESPETFVISDTTRDPDYVAHPLVTDAPHFRFYAGHPLTTLDGHRVGTFCILDTRPRNLSSSELHHLLELASWAERKINTTAFGDGQLEFHDPADRRFATLMEALPIGVAVWDGNNRPYFANGVARHYFQRGLSLDPERPIHTHEHTLHTLVDNHIDSGTHTDLAVRATRLVSPTGHTTHIIALLDDVTRLHRTQAHLAATEDTYKELFENATDLVFVCAHDGKLLHINATWAELLGVSRGQLLHTSFFDLIHSAERGHARVLFERLKAGEDIDAFKITLTGPKNKRVLVEGHLTCKRVDGVPVAIRGILRDVTGRSRVDHLKNEFISIVHRELRTPITSIRGALGIVAGGLSGPLSPQARTLVEVAYRSSERLQRLLGDLLEIEKIELGWTSFDFQDVGLGELVKDAINDEHSLGAELGINFVVSNAAPDVRVHADPTRIAQVLLNLLSNAAKFSPEHGVVTLEIQRRCWHARVSVTDHGPGVAPDLGERIFHKFERGAHTECGPGIGLSLCKAIVEKHGGRIGFENHHPGVTFFFEIPLAGDENCAEH